MESPSIPSQTIQPLIPALHHFSVAHYLKDIHLKEFDWICKVADRFDANSTKHVSQHPFPLGDDYPMGGDSYEADNQTETSTVSSVEDDGSEYVLPWL